MTKVAFTAGRVAAFQCPEGRAQAFLWDKGVLGLGLRITPHGRPAYVFQSEYAGKSLRMTIGSPDVWTISHAQQKARELQRLIDEGRDPRAVKAANLEAESQAKARKKRDATTVGEAWDVYLEERKEHWGARHLADHIALAKAGGELARRGTDGRGVTIAGPIHPLLSMRLTELTGAVVEAWAVKEAKTRKTYGRLALRCLKAFLTWCSERDEYQSLIQANPAKSKKARQAFGKPAVKSDVLLKEQLAAWFKAVRAIRNPAIAAYPQMILLLGARPSEVLELQWDDINFHWKSITLRDKVEGDRTIPLTPFVEALLQKLPRSNDWVFASTSAKRGRMAIPRKAHVDACTAALIEGLTFHGLRRSFKSLTEWLEIPAGVVAQIMGHKPSATAERHYTVRPLDLIRLHHVKIEQWILEHAAVHR